jgi:D-amino peptidase
VLKGLQQPFRQTDGSRCVASLGAIRDAYLHGEDDNECRDDDSMNVYISADIEGVAGIVDWDQAVPGSDFYGQGTELLVEEINAAIDGAQTSGATRFLVNDAHHKMHNLDPTKLAGDAAYLSGRLKPGYMMEGLSRGHDAIFFLGYHGGIGTGASVLSHTYSPALLHEVTLNDEPVGEGSINALVALGLEVPVALVTGDRITAESLEQHLPGAEKVIVKESVTRFSALNTHPRAARLAIARGAARALKKLPEIELPSIELPATIGLRLMSPDQAELATFVTGVERSGDRDVRLTDDDPIALYRRFVAVLHIANAARDL